MVWWDLVQIHRFAKRANDPASQKPMQHPKHQRLAQNINDFLRGSFHSTQNQIGTKHQRFLLPRGCD